MASALAGAGKTVAEPCAVAGPGARVHRRPHERFHPRRPRRPRASASTAGVRNAPSSTSGAVDATIARLQSDGLIYEGTLEPPKGKLPEDWEAREQTLFRATRFGDDVDRPLRKSDGSNTYFANDIAYHADKIAAASTC